MSKEFNDEDYNKDGKNKEEIIETLRYQNVLEMMQVFIQTNKLQAETLNGIFSSIVKNASPNNYKGDQKSLLYNKTDIELFLKSYLEQHKKNNK